MKKKINILNRVFNGEANISSQRNNYISTNAENLNKSSTDSKAKINPKPEIENKAPFYSSPSF